jgi:hypothetical protein
LPSHEIGGLSKNELVHSNATPVTVLDLRIESFSPKFNFFRGSAYEPAVSLMFTASIIVSATVISLVGDPI